MPEPSIELLIFVAFALIAAIQLFYYLFFFSRLAFYKPAEKKEQYQHPISVIVCAKDEDENLARNVPGLVFQQYPSTYEVLIVNDNSEDDTKFILQELQKEFKHIRVITLQQPGRMIPGKKYPLSIGIREAKHELLLLTDADCVPASEHWVQKMQAAYDEGIDIVLGYGAYIKYKGWLNRLIRFETFHTALQYFSYALAGLPYMGVGRNLSYKRSLFLNNKGFSASNHLPGGDDDLFINKVATSKNTAIVIDPEAHTISKPKKTWRQWRQQKARHYSVSKYYKGKHKWLLGLYSFSHFLFYPLLIAAAILFTWWWAVGIFLLRLMVQYLVMGKAMKKLNEADLIKWIFAMDLWMFFYYLFFSPLLLKKAKKSW
ncbi:MAG: glycosyltransferase [Niabella sp.]